MPHPDPGRREHLPLGISLLAGVTPEQAQAVVRGIAGVSLIERRDADHCESLLAIRSESRR